MVFVFIYSLWQVAGKSNVKRSVAVAGQNINVIIFLIC